MKTYADFKKHVFIALENSDISVKEVITDESEGVTVKVDKSTSASKIKIFIDSLKEQELKFRSSFNPESEIINISITNSK
ncbi:hypothetical protein [Emticicia sp. C21]|uniref:hypothetical protein n=1 Tax=Emticicia sp. C21 TaxID=2302915 RepID=UPI000E35131A|nr:hypothetical protein [Emticicia sp. C21]RFS13327.1 hypothetical protein D0T08_27180 [Emticicia sp. C21]